MRKQVLSLVVLAALFGCQMPSSTTGSGTGEESTGAASEAERTRQIEEKAAEIARMEEDLRNMQGTEQEKIDAMNRIEEKRRELMELQESGGSL